MRIPLLAHICTSSLLLLVAIGFFRYRMLRSDMRVLFGYFVVSLVFTVTMLILAINRVNNLWMLHILNLVEFYTFVLVLSSWQTNSRVALVLRRDALIGFAVIWVASKLSLEKLQYFDNFSSGLASVTIIFFVCYTIFNVYYKSSHGTLHSYQLLVLCATLVYQLTKVVVYSSGNFILDLPPETIKMVWSLHWGVTSLAYFLYSGAFLVRQARRDASPSTNRINFAF